MNKSVSLRCALLLALLPLLFWQGCKECDDPTDPDCPNYCMDETNPDCPNFDPCLDKVPVSAAFEIREAFFLGYPDGWIQYDTDTVATGLVEFHALEPDAQYEWQLGSEVIRTRSFARSDFPEGNILVRLKVTKPANTRCFPDDDGEDVQVRTFYQKAGCSSLLNGRYRGILKEVPMDTFEVAVNRCYSPDIWNPTFNIRPIIVGFEPQCDTLFIYTGDQKSGWSHRELLIGQGGVDNGPCLRLEGLMMLQANNLDSIYFDYSHKVCLDCSTRVQKQFRGIRIHE